MLVVREDEVKSLVKRTVGDEFYRKNVLEFLRGKYFGDGKCTTSLFRIFTKHVKGIREDDDLPIKDDEAQGLCVTFKIGLEDGDVYVKRTDSEADYFDKRVRKFMGYYVEELTGFEDKEIIDKTLGYLQIVCMAFENRLLSNLERKVSYGAMRLNCYLKFDGTMIFT